MYLLEFFNWTPHENQLKANPNILCGCPIVYEILIKGNSYAWKISDKILQPTYFQRTDLLL